MKHLTANQLLSKPTILSLVISLALLGGCSSDSDSDDDLTSSANEVAIVATAASDNSSGAHAVISTTEPFTTQQELAPTGSDITVNAFGSNFYRIERKDSDSVTRFDISDPETPITQFSTLDAGEEGSANPHALVFESDEKAYLMRYGKTIAWAVNPLATTTAEFKTSEIDLSDYDPGDGSVEMTAGVISNGKLFILMQRLDINWTPQDAYVAVIDTSTNTEINTATNDLNKGIKLPIKNPNDIQIDDNGEIYISGAGNVYASPPEYTGGIVTLDSESFEVTMLIDDGDADNHPYENITGVEIVSADKGYLISYKGWKDTSLYAFNPVTGVVDAEPIEGMTGLNLSALATDSSDRLWVSVSASTGRDAGVRIYNTTDNTLVGDEIPLAFNPLKIVFATTQSN